MASLRLLAAAACLALLLINGAESRHHRGHHDDHRGHHDDHDHHRGHHGGHGDDDDSPPAEKKMKLLVFGDDFVDNGNYGSDADDDQGQGMASRQWRYPYGMSDRAHERKPTGRFSDGLVQSDYLAKIMGHGESPPAYALMKDSGDDYGMDASGMNFAVGGSYVLKPAADAATATTLRDQVDHLRSMLDDGLVELRDLRDAVALVASSGYDYADSTSADGDTLVALSGKVVAEMAKVVDQLQDLGVGKVIVNTLPPFGCTPWQARWSNYSGCDGGGNTVSDKHNAALQARLGGAEADGVMLLDVNTVLTELSAPKPGSTLAPKLTERLRPCCESVDADGGYCGEDDRYWLCEHPEEYLYWDFLNPTQAGWRAVMQYLQGQIMAFLGISTLNHL